MKLLLGLTLLLLVSIHSFSQNQFIVYFTDKGDSYVELTERAIERRSKNRVKPDERDKVIKQNYLDELATQGTLKNTSRWLNAALFETHLTASELTAKFDFIHSLKPISVVAKKTLKYDLDLSRLKYGFTLEDMDRSTDYGIVDGQIRQINANCLHESGFNGEGIYVAVIDAGFKGIDTVSYFQTAWAEGRVLDTFNFIHDSSIFKYSGHGTAVSSCIIAEQGGPKSYYGMAVDASIALYVTEDVSSETEAEEFNLVAALERCDVQGVDIANISLGYRFFDDPEENHAYEDMDGETTVAAMGVNTAASKGIVVVCSAGNSGPGYISTPCDADSTLCVGAVNVDGLFAPFSSLGPSSDDQVKPDVATTGWKAWVVIDNGARVQGNGTSFSSPLMTGGIACLMQANPDATVIEIISAVQESGSIADSPSPAIGYGIPDLCDADKRLGGSASLNDDSDLDFLSVFPNPATHFIQISGFQPEQSYQLEMVNQLGQIVYSNQTTGVSTQYIDLPSLSQGVYVLHVDGVFLEKIVVR